MAGDVPALWDRLGYGDDHHDDHGGGLGRRLVGCELAIFLDYDGTLTPIVEHPAAAILDDGMRRTLSTLSRRWPVAIVSGRDLDDVRRLVGIASLVYAGSHGFDIAGPRIGGEPLRLRAGAAFAADLERAEQALRTRLAGVPGAVVDRQAFTISVHYRLAAAEDVACVGASVDEVLAMAPRLRRTGGKKVIQVRPRTAWGKGEAVLWLLRRLNLNRDDVVPVYIGDDETDEDAFRALLELGVGIIVRDGGDETKPTAARCVLSGPAEVQRFLDWLCYRDRRLPVTPAD